MFRLAIAALAASFLVAGCSVATQPTADELTEFNKAQQQGTQQLILLNVLRARDHQPMGYSHFDVLRGGVTANSSIGFQFPFGSNATLLDPNLITGGLGVSPGVSQDVKPQDDQNFYRGVLTPITQETWALYQDQNWPQNLLFHLFVEGIKLSPDDFASIENNSGRVCNEHRDIAEVAEECAVLAQQHAAIAALPDCQPLQHLVNGKLILEVWNDAGDRCHTLRFEAFTQSLIILGFHITQQKSAKDIGPALDASSFRDPKWPSELKDANIDLARSSDGRGYQFQQVSKSYVVELDNLPCAARANVAVAATSQLNSQISAMKSADEVKLRSATAPAACDNKALLDIGITTHSPDGMLYYLGEVARAELPLHAGDPTQTVCMRDDAAHCSPLVRIVAASDSDAATQVDYHGVTYSVPRGDDHVTMQAFELVQQVFALYNQASLAPSTTAVTVVP
jgi:hypothetical protein